MQTLPESAMLLPVREHAVKLFTKGWPDLAALSEMAEGIVNGQGLPIKFVEDCGDEYERRIYLTGEIQTRNGSWHDLFNALAWMTFPKTKSHLNSIHFEALSSETGRNRGRARDIATLFDESGVIIASSDESLSNQLRDFEWRSLFWENRKKVVETMRFYIFGHGLFEKALAPFVGLTGHGILFHVEESFFSLPIEKQLAILDESFEYRYAEIKTTRDFSPVPLLGYPGWSDENSVEAFYENESYFRKGRRSGMRGS